MAIPILSNILSLPQIPYISFILIIFSLLNFLRILGKVLSFIAAIVLTFLILKFGIYSQYLSVIPSSFLPFLGLGLLVVSVFSGPKKKQQLGPIGQTPVQFGELTRLMNDEKKLERKYYWFLSKGWSFPAYMTQRKLLGIRNRIEKLRRNVGK